MISWIIKVHWHAKQGGICVREHWLQHQPTGFKFQVIHLVAIRLWVQQNFFSFLISEMGLRVSAMSIVKIVYVSLGAQCLALRTHSFILILVSLDLQYEYLGKHFSLLLRQIVPSNEIEYVRLCHEMHMRNQRKVEYLYYTPAPVIVWGTDFTKQPGGLMATEWERDFPPVVLGSCK